jgi:hypothetical protein
MRSDLVVIIGIKYSCERYTRTNANQMQNCKDIQAKAKESAMHKRCKSTNIYKELEAHLHSAISTEGTGCFFELLSDLFFKPRGGM